VARKKFDRSLLPPSPDFAFEQELWTHGTLRIAGVDEAGRGALAGPVCAAAVVLPADLHLTRVLKGVNDSKQLSAAQREHWRRVIPEIALGSGIGFASADEIDTFGIVPATRLAIRRALLQIDPLPDHLLVDHLKLPEIPIPQTSLVKGDARSLSIAAASILAKTARDAVMLTLADQHPGYAWQENKGYGTEAHLTAIREMGPCRAHRLTFAPIRNDLSGRKDSHK